MVGVGGKANTSAGRRRIALVVACAVAVIAASCSMRGSAAPKGSATNPTGGLRVTTVSTKADLVSGDDVLIAVSGVPAGAVPVLSVDGDDRAGALAAIDKGVWSGLIDGLSRGSSTITVQAGDRSGQLQVVSHPITGPVLSGPQQHPYACTTVENGLGDPIDPECSATTSVSWSYVNQNGVVAKLVDPQQIPADVKSIDVGARSVPFMIRTESGTINRAVYWISVLDPTPSSNGWEGVSDGWNENLVYRFGGGCGTTFSQGDALVSAGDGTRTAPTADPDLLSRGYAVATATLNTFQVACNDVLSAETTLMVKEHFVEHYGRPDATIGEGGSGGAIQQLLVAQNYPGLLDALSVSAPFPDAMSIAPGVSDCGLLEHYYTTTGRLHPDARAAHRHQWPCHGEDLRELELVLRRQPRPDHGLQVAAGVRVQPRDQPRPVRAARSRTPTSTCSVVTRAPVSPTVRSTTSAWRTGSKRCGAASSRSTSSSISTPGSGDGTSTATSWPSVRWPTRTTSTGSTATAASIRAVGTSPDIPIIVTNAYSDPTGDIHDRWRAFQVRERLANGDEAPANLAIWTVPGGSLGGSLTGGPRDVRNESIDAIQAWLDNLAEVKSRPKSAKEWRRTLAATQPAAAMNRCVVSDTLTLTGADVYEGVNSCTHAYPLYGDPRRAAGAGLGSIAGKCQLTPANARAIGVDLTADQESQLGATFPDGVCDWSRPGVAQAPVQRTWISYGDDATAPPGGG